ncbi:MAG: ABC transporter ATP-binding protein, partial [Verrucomicrobiota bacterium]
LVAIRGVQFGYQSPRPVLRGIDLDLFPGETVALVGPSGSGKTTLLQLLPRFHDPDAGTVEIGGIRLPEWDLAALRRQIAVVPQEPVLFPGTVAENIAAGRPDASAAEIERAAREAQAAEFIRRLPLGYETRLGDAAARLSVGEKQRINLARAFLKDAPILLLDEPTSALDPANEEALLAALDRLRAGRTTLMVAHRLVTLAGADRVALLLDGRLADLRRQVEIPDLNAWMKTVTNRANA